MSNTIAVIRPYKWEGIWVFDDPSVGLHREAFVAGADTLIDLATAKKGIRTPEKGFVLLFSATPFPTAEFELTWVREECGGNVYLWEQVGQEGWLCPSLFKYFPSAPKKIYIQIKEAEST